MKILKIESSKGLFLNSKGNYVLIDEITKEDLLRLVEHIVEDEKSELDDFNGIDIVNPAQKIIYENVYNKFSEIKTQREIILNNKNKLYSEAFEKYNNN